MERIKHHRRGIGLLAGLLLLLGVGIGVAAANQQPVTQGRVLRVAFSELVGISETDPYGNRSGLLVDYLNEIAKYTDWEYEYIPVAGDEMIPRFLNGEFDLMGGAFYAPGFEEHFAYPNYSTGRSRAVLLCQPDDDSLRGYDLTTLNGKTIGVYAMATEKIQYLNDFLVSNDLDCTLRYYSRADMNADENLYDHLRNGEVDMLLGNNLEIGGEFRMVTSFSAQPYYIVTTVGNTEVLDELNRALEYILESTPNFAEEAYERNFPDAKWVDIQFNEGERRYIAQNRTLTVAVPSRWHPLYCMDNPSDLHQGLLPELLKEIHSFTGLEFSFVCTDTYADAVRMVQEGKADILGGYLGEEEEAFSDGLALSQSYISLSNIVLKHKSVSYPAAGLTGGVLTGRTLPDSFGAAEQRSYDTVQQMMAAVNSGEVDFIYGASAMLEQEMQNHRYLNVVPVSQASDSTNVAFALSRPIAPELLTILNKAISNIPTNVKTEMLNKNLVSMGYTNLSLQELIYANPVAFMVLFGAVVVLLSTGSLLIIKSRMKNTLMQSQLEAAEAKSMAKSEFLARMSHEIRTPMNAIVGLTDLTCMEPDLSPDVKNKLQKIRGSSQYLLSLINDILDMSRIENEKMEIEQENFSLAGILDALQSMMSTQAEQKALCFQIESRIDHNWLVGDPIRLRQILTNLLSNAIKFTDAGGTVLLQVEETASDDQTATIRFSVRDTGMGIRPEGLGRIFLSFEQLTASTSRSVGTGLGLPISRNIARLMGGDLQVKSEYGAGSEFYTTLRFPLGTETSPEPAPVEQTWEPKGVHILLAEDNDLNAEIAQELLQLQGIQVQRAVDGKQAVDLFTANPPNTYQVILMDIRMPMMDGHEAARAIRASGRPDADIPIIAMTANSFREDEIAAREAGMNGFVPKPVDPNYLFSVLRDILPVNGGTSIF